MGLSYSYFGAAPKAPTKPATLLPLVGNGEYEVGCADVMVKGESDGDPGIFARVFYPSTLKSESLSDIKRIEYPVWRPRNEYIVGLAEYRQVSAMKINFFLDWVIGERRVPAGWHEPLFHHARPDFSSSEGGEAKAERAEPTAESAQGEPSFPVLIFSHGISGNRLCYSTFCASLASHGFVVAAIEHRDRSSSWTYYLEKDASTGELLEKPIRMTTFPDGEEEFKARNLQVQKRVAECVRCLNFLEELNLGQNSNSELNCGGKIIHGEDFNWSQFKGRLDISKAAVIGHSFGGAAAIAAAAYSTDFQASVVLDGWLYPLEHELYSRTTQPALLLNASRWQWQENVRRMMRLDTTTSEKIILTFKDIVHQTFSDFGFLTPGYLGRHFSLQGDLEPSYTGKAIMEVVVGYLRQCFQHGGTGALDAVRTILKPYEHFVVEGTDLDLSQAAEVGQQPAADATASETAAEHTDPSDKASGTAGEAKKALNGDPSRKHSVDENPKI